ncbi:MAG: hypothetical protein MJ239_06160, partial [Bacilli bacterium]|nr:hypothetical protein [Bacilli bacterium]
GSSSISSETSTINEKEIIKNEQTGRCLSAYFDAVARQPEAKESLDKAQKALLNAFGAAETESQCYGIGNLGGAKNNERFADLCGDGVFDSIARQPEISENLLTIEKTAIEKILNSKEDVFSEMIGLSAAALFDGTARTPEQYEDFYSYFNYIADAICGVKATENAYSIGYASVGFFAGVARQPSAKDEIWETFKSYIDNIEKE